MKPKIFFSHGLRKNKSEAGAVAFFKNLLIQEIGEENIFEGEEITDTGMFNITLAKIDKCQGVLVVFPRRGKIEHSDYATSANVVFETGYATKLGIPCFGFREKGVSEGRVGMIQFSTFYNDKSVVPFGEFSTNEVERNAKKAEFKTYIRNALKKIECKDIAGFHHYPYCEKEVAIYEKGYGRILTKYSLEILQDGLKKITSMDHHFDLKDSTPKKVGETPYFSKIIKGIPSGNFKDELPFFSYKLIDPKSKFSMKHKIIKESSKEGIDFNFIFEGNFKKRDVLKYEWLIQGPDFFRISSFNSERKKSEDAVKSHFKLPWSSRVEIFKFIIEFKEGVKSLLQEPVFETFQDKKYLKDNQPNDPAKKAEVIDKNILRDRYEAVFEGITTPSGIVRAIWIPK